MAAAVELGLAPERLVMVAEPAQQFDDAQWADVLAAMIDGFDVLLLGPGVHGVRAGTARRLSARLQQRGAVMFTVAGVGGAPGPFGADLRFVATDTAWQGLGEGHGITVTSASASTRRSRVRAARRAELWLPTADGAVEAVSFTVAPLPVPLPAPLSVPVVRSVVRHGVSR